MSVFVHELQRRGGCAAWAAAAPRPAWRLGLTGVACLILAGLCPALRSVEPPLTFAACLRADSAPAVAPVEGFSAYGGVWRVEDGVLQAEGGPGPKLVATTPEVTTGQVGVEVLLPDATDGNAGLILKASDCAVGADNYNGYEISLNGAGYLVFGRHRQNWTPIREVPMPVPQQRWLALVVTFTETTLAVSVDGRQVLTYEDSEAPLRRGRLGLRPWQRRAQFRNLWYVLDGQRTDVPFVPGHDQQREALDGLLSRAVVPRFAVLTRYPLSRPNTISCDLWQSQPSRPGCSLRIVDPAMPGAPATTIFADPQGCIYDLNLTPDARSLLFSYRRAVDGPYWHIWRINVDGSGLQQLTDGPFYDVSPCPMPNGRIVFVSTRRFGYTVCQPGPASNLHSMAADGSDIRCVSMNTLSDFSPQMLPDGRVLFTRWEYIDRDLTYRQSLWTQNPDGSGYQLYFGNTIRDVATFWQARPLPGRSDLVVATFAPHHGFPHGALGVIDRRAGVEAPRGVGYGWITHEFPDIGDTCHEWSYRDPFPLDASLLLCAYGGGERFRIYLVGAWDRQRLLYEDPEMSCFFPLPLRPMAVPPLLPERSAPPPATTATFALTDVYLGLAGIERGRVKALRIMEQVRKTEDLARRAFDQSPVMSYGTYYAKRTWGTVPVAEDGSAHFRAPALRELYFQALDADGRELQRMTSAAQAMPGETVGCNGCHESRQVAPPARSNVPLALRDSPVEPVLPAYVPAGGIIDFPTVVQPVLDRHCSRCHSGPDPKGGMLLTGDATRFFSMAYENLLGRSRSYRQHDLASGDMLPQERERGKPLVHFYWLLRTPTAVNRPLQTGSHASRLPEYIETPHSGSALPLEDRQRLYTWIDADVPYYGTYANSRPLSPGRRDLCTDVATGKESAWFAELFRGLYDRRCASCHGAIPDPNDHSAIWDGRLAWIDFSHPEWSPALTAHLAKPHGRGITTPKDGVAPPAFADPTDPDYQALLKAIREGQALMLATPRADQPGFAGQRPEP
jgi:hypothetical protein